MVSDRLTTSLVVGGATRRLRSLAFPRVAVHARCLPEPQPLDRWMQQQRQAKCDQEQQQPQQQPLG